MSTPSGKTITSKAQRGRRKWVIILSLAANFAIAVLAGIWLNSQRTIVHPKVQPGPPIMTTVVIAAVDIPAQMVITPGMVKLGRVTPDKAMPGAAVYVADVLDKTTILPIKKGQQIVRAQFDWNAPTFGDRVVMIGPRQRSMTVPLDPDSSVAGFLKPFEFVDVIRTSTVGSRTITGTVLRHVEIMSAGTQVLKATSLPNGSNKDVIQPNPQSAALRAIPNATLYVTPIEKRRLSRAARSGMLSLVYNDGGKQIVVRISGQGWGGP
jgi:pilus assembly protein CpaB